jgi:hypothetical protein
LHFKEHPSSKTSSAAAQESKSPAELGTSSQRLEWDANEVAAEEEGEQISGKI